MQKLYLYKNLKRTFLFIAVLPVLALQVIIPTYDAQFDHPGFISPHCTHQIPDQPQKFFLGFYWTFKALIVDFKNWKQTDSIVREFESIYASTASSASGIPIIVTQTLAKLRTVFFNQDYTKLIQPTIVSDKGTASLSNPVAVSKTVYIIYSFRYNPAGSNDHKFFKMDMSDQSIIILPVLEGSFISTYQDSSSYIIGTIDGIYVVVDHT